MKKLKYIAVLAVLMVSGKLFAQQEPAYSMYRYNMNIINPAFAGVTGYTNLNLHVRTQWTDIDDAPETQTIAFTKPIGDRIGIGFSIVNDRIDITKETNYTADFSYRLQLSEKSDLHLGVKAGAYSLNQDLLSANIPSDPLFDENISRVNAIFGAGAYFKTGKFYASLSTPNFLNGKRVETTGDDEFANGTDKMHLYAGTGYTFDFGENLELTPSLMARFVEAAPALVDIAATVNMYQMVEVGVSYRWDNSITGIALIRASDWFQFGYAYEATTSVKSDDSLGGSHEFMLRFRFNSSKEQDPEL